MKKWDSLFICNFGNGFISSPRTFTAFGWLKNTMFLKASVGATWRSGAEKPRFLYLFHFLSLQSLGDYTMSFYLRAYSTNRKIEPEVIKTDSHLPMRDNIPLAHLWHLGEKSDPVHFSMSYSDLEGGCCTWAQNFKGRPLKKRKEANVSLRGRWASKALFPLESELTDRFSWRKCQFRDQEVSRRKLRVSSEEIALELLRTLI